MLKSNLGLLLVLCIVLQSLMTVAVYEHHNIDEVDTLGAEHHHYSNEWLVHDLAEVHTDSDCQHCCHLNCPVTSVIVSCQYSIVFSKQGSAKGTPYQSLFISSPASSLYRPPIA